MQRLMKVSKKKRAYDKDTLYNLVSQQYSCVCIKKCIRKITLEVIYFNNVKAGIVESLDKGVKQFDARLNGILLGYQNIKILPDRNYGRIVGKNGEFEVTIEVELFVFQPEIGSILEGQVNVKGSNHIGVLVHELFNARILKPDNVDYNNWNCKNINTDDKILFEVVELDFSGKVPYIGGKITIELLEESTGKMPKGKTLIENGVACSSTTDAPEMNSNYQSDSEKTPKSSHKKHKKAESDKKKGFWAVDTSTSFLSGIDTNLESTPVGEYASGKVKKKKSKNSNSESNYDDMQISYDVASDQSSHKSKKKKSKNKEAEQTTQDFNFMDDTIGVENTSNKAKKKKSKNKEKNQSQFDESFQETLSTSVACHQDAETFHDLSIAQTTSSEPKKKKKKRDKEKSIDETVENINSTQISEDLPSSSKKKKKKKNKKEPAEDADMSSFLKTSYENVNRSTESVQKKTLSDSPRLEDFIQSTQITPRKESPSLFQIFSSKHEVKTNKKNREDSPASVSKKRKISELDGSLGKTRSGLDEVKSSPRHEEQILFLKSPSRKSKESESEDKSFKVLDTISKKPESSKKKKKKLKAEESCSSEVLDLTDEVVAKKDLATEDVIFVKSKTLKKNTNTKKHDFDCSSDDKKSKSATPVKRHQGEDEGSPSAKKPRQDDNTAMRKLMYPQSSCEKSLFSDSDASRPSPIKLSESAKYVGELMSDSESKTLSEKTTAQKFKSKKVSDSVVTLSDESGKKTKNVKETEQIKSSLTLDSPQKKSIPSKGIKSPTGKNSSSDTAGSPILYDPKQKSKAPGQSDGEFTPKKRKLEGPDKAAEENSKKSEKSTGKKTGTSRKSTPKTPDPFSNMMIEHLLSARKSLLGMDVSLDGPKKSRKSTGETPKPERSKKELLSSFDKQKETP